MYIYLYSFQCSTDDSVKILMIVLGNAQRSCSVLWSIYLEMKPLKLFCSFVIVLLVECSSKLSGSDFGMCEKTFQ